MSTETERWTCVLWNIFKTSRNRLVQCWFLVTYDLQPTFQSFCFIYCSSQVHTIENSVIYPQANLLFTLTVDVSTIHLSSFHLQSTASYVGTLIPNLKKLKVSGEVIRYCCIPIFSYCLLRPNLCMIFGYIVPHWWTRDSASLHFTGIPVARCVTTTIW